MSRVVEKVCRKCGNLFEFIWASKSAIPNDLLCIDCANKENEEIKKDAQFDIDCAQGKL
jgi:hypothetical protein